MGNTLKLVGVIALIITIPLRVGGVSASSYEHEVPGSLAIAMGGTDYKKYVNLLSKIKNDSSRSIKEDYKSKYFKVFGGYTDASGSQRLFSGKARITGDWKDHVDIEKHLSSLSVSLKEGNIGGIVRFRLLLPETKNGNDEIFWSLLMTELGFPVPYRRILELEVMGQKLPMILEEKPAKEFLESNAMRETPIVEYDERQLWSMLYEFDSWEAEGLMNINQLKVKNSQFLKNKIAYEISYRGLKYNFKKTAEFFTKFEEVNKAYAPHGLGAHNRKYIYDAFYNTHIPIYFDGMVEPKTTEEAECAEDYVTLEGAKLSMANLLQKHDPRIRKLAARFRDRVLDSHFPDWYGCVAARVFETVGNAKLTPLVVEPIINPSEWTAADVQIPFPGRVIPWVYRYDPYLGVMWRCEFKQAAVAGDDGLCEEISEKLKRRVFTGDDPAQTSASGRQHSFLEVVYTPRRNEQFKRLNLKGEHYRIRVPSGTTTFVKLSAENSSIQVELEDETSLVAFYGSKFQRSRIDISSKKIEPVQNDVRYDNRLLTGCATFVDSTVDDSKIFSNGCGREDAINFIRVKGKGLSIEILSASFDAFDADFSDLQIAHIAVRNAQNDCLDVSSGIYNINSAEFFDCGDKGFSFGEKSIATVTDIAINNANIGIASKDGSQVWIGKLLRIEDVATCLTSYQKKQEFGSGAIFYSALPSSCDVQGERDVSLSKTLCRFVDRNQFFSTCVTSTALEISWRRSLPEKFSFELDGIDLNVPEDCYASRDCSTRIPFSASSKDWRLALSDKKTGFLAAEVNHVGATTP